MDIKISQLSAASAFDGSELFEVVQGGSNKKATATQIATYTGSSLGITALTAGRVLFAGSATTVSTDSNLFWDNTNKKLSIAAGTSPTARLEITEDGTNAGIRLNHGASNTWASIEGPLNRDLRFVLRDNDSSDAFEFWTNNGGASAVRFEITSAGIARLNTVPTNNDGNTALLARNTSTGNIETVASSTFQPADDELTAIAGLTSAADRGIYFTGSGSASLFTLTSFARTLLDDASASAARTTLGLVIGTDVQAFDAELAAIAGLTSAADRVPYFTGSGTAALATFTAFGRSLVDDANAAAALTTLGVSAFIQTLLDDADAATARATLGVVASSSGTYSPTATTTGSVSSAGASSICQYLRVGNTVTVSGLGNVAANAAGSKCTFYLSLPVASAIDFVDEVAGTGVVEDSGTNPTIPMKIQADPIGNRAELQFYSEDTTSHAFTFTFTYTVN